jgi:hypothetical protein
VGTITAQNIVDRASKVLQDTLASRRWGEDDQLVWLNEGQREIVSLKPDANTQNAAAQLTSGTKQTIPTGGLMLFNVTRNMGTDGSTAGNAILPIDMEAMDLMHPGWHAVTATTAISYFMFDPRDPKNWYCYPPSDGTGYAEQVYSKVPTDVSAIDSAIGLDDIYAPALLDYLLYRDFSYDADFADNAARAHAHWAAFLQKIGRRDLVEAKNNPNVPGRIRAQAELAGR